MPMPLRARYMVTTIVVSFLCGCHTRTERRGAITKGQSGPTLCVSSGHRGYNDEVGKASSIPMLTNANSKSQIDSFASQLQFSKVFEVGPLAARDSWIVVIHPITSAFNRWEVHLYMLDLTSQPGKRSWRMVNASSWDWFEFYPPDLKVARVFIDFKSGRLIFVDLSGGELAAFGLEQLKRQLP